MLLHREDIEPPDVEVLYPARPGESPSAVPVAKLYPGYTRFKESLLTDDSENHRIWKTCEHYKCSLVPGSGDMSPEVSIDIGDTTTLHRSVIESPSGLYTGAFGTFGEFNSGLPTYYSPRDDGGFVPPPSDLDSLVSHALRAMMPKIKAELSVVNSLIELKDILTFRSTIEGVKNTIQRFITKKSVPLRDLFRTKADVYLQYKFNIAPLLSDISGIYRSLADTERRINDLVNRSGRVRISHFTRSLTESDVPESSTGRLSCGVVKGYPSLVGEAQIWSNIEERRYTSIDPATFHVQVQYNYNYTGYQVEHARLLATLDALGVNLDPSIIWNAIPWSFVVDWVFGVGRYLDSIKVGNMDPKINILQCLWSYKRSRRILVTGTVYSAENLGEPPSLTSHFVRPVVVESAYRRQVFSPSGSSIESSGLTPTEFSLGAALVLSQRRRPKRLRR
jgi:hypothetical protein